MVSSMGSSACILRRWSRGATEMMRSSRRYNSYESAAAAAAADRSVPPWLLHKGGGDRGAEIVGYSHGWVALFNRRKNDLFLSDRFSERCIKLPAIHTLPDPLLNLDMEGLGSVSKVILSSSSIPRDQDELTECRAMVIFGPAKRLAFCLPGRSSEWTPIGDLFVDDNKTPCIMFAMAHQDLVYCSRRKLFASITTCHVDLNRFAFFDKRVNFCPMIFEWDIQDPTRVDQSEMYLGMSKGKKGGRGGGGGGGGGGERTRVWLEENKEFLQEQCIQIPHLVYAEHSDELLLVLRFVMLMNPADAASPLPYTVDDASCPVRGLRDVFPAKTFGFAVMRMDKVEVTTYWSNTECTMVDDLGGTTIFVGVNHSFAIPSAQLPHLKSNSIYFSDAKRNRMLDGANDNGVFDYQTKTISNLNL